MSTAAMVIDSRPKALGDIMGRLEVLIDAISRAEVPSAKTVKGPHRKLDALQIAKAAARDYNFLTRTMPNRSENRGGFPDFLAAILTALERHESVENLARQACEWWNSDDRVRDDQAEFDKLMANPLPAQ